MIEMLGVLAIIGVLSVGGIAGYSKAMLKYKTNKTIDQITMLTTNIRTLYAQQDTFYGLDGTTSSKLNAISMGVVPDEMIVSDTKLGNPFSGSVIIDVDNSIADTAGTNRAFIIGVDGLPKEACMAIATSDWGSNYSSGLIAMAANNHGAVEAQGETPAQGNAASALVNIYAGDACTASAQVGVPSNAGVICAAHMPLQVAEASKACNCDGSTCSVAFKYY